MASYQVSGAGETAVNGTYVENGTYNGKPMYQYVAGTTTYTMQYANATEGWMILVGDNVSSFLYNGVGDTPDTAQWSFYTRMAPAPTVTKVADSSGGSTGGKAYKVTFSGASVEADGIYRESGTYNGFPAYKHEKLEYYIWTILAANDYMHYLGTPLGGSPPLWYYNSGSNADDIAGSWGQASSTTPGPTVTEYTEDTSGEGGSAGGDDSGGDSDGTTIAGYRIAGAGNASANGEYLPQGEYNGKPLYYYAASSLYLRWSGSNWQITTVGASSATVTPQYYNNNSGATPDVGTWVNAVGAAPAPTVTVIEGAGDAGGGVVDPEDTTIIVPDSTPEVGEKGLKVGNMFIPVCPNPVDTHLSKVSDTGKNIALGWLGFGDGVDITGLDVQIQALTDGWLSAHVTATAGGQYLELLVYRGDNDSEHRYGNTRYSYSSGDLRAMMFVPRGMFYKVRSNATLIKALWLPCNGASE